jgi:excisionase family DNA binding protein
MTKARKIVKSHLRRLEAASDPVNAQGISDPGGIPLARGVAPAMIDGSEIFYTVYNVADDLQVCTRQVNRWIENGSLIAHRFGRSVRIAKADLTAFLAVRRGGRHDIAA